MAHEATPPYPLLGTFGERLRRQSLEEFLALYPCPFLLVRLRPDPDGQPRFETTDSDERGRGPRPPDDSQILVIPVRKSDRNGFAGMVTIGRAANNDIVLPHGSVSKFHASIQLDALAILDADSRYGTFVEGTPAGAIPRPLRDGATILFGTQVEATLVTAESLFTRLRSD